MSSSEARFTQAHVDQWREEGFAIIPEFFSADEVAPLRAEYQRMYGTRAPAVPAEAPAEDDMEARAAFRRLQFKNIDTFPFDAEPAVSLVGLHPQLIEFARQLLGVEKVHMYQCHTWAKFTGETNYDQFLHCDYNNHTLLVPSDTVAERTVDFILYFTDVTDAHGALHYVTRPDANQVLGEGAVRAVETLTSTMKQSDQDKLQELERSAAAPAGSLVAHSIDTFHRGTNLTAPAGYRYTMTVGFKAAGNDMIGFTTWQVSAGRNWEVVFANASPEQLACIGVPLPGDSYWTARTLALTADRWPAWDMSAYVAAFEGGPGDPGLANAAG